MSYTTYCSREDVTKRLSPTGLAYCADDDLDGVGEQDNVNATDEAIAAAGSEIDFALCQWFPVVPLPQTTRNETLRLWAVDLAVDYLATRRGGSINEAFSVRAAAVRENLSAVRKGSGRIPGLIYPTDQYEQERRNIGLPRVANPRRA